MSLTTLRIILQWKANQRRASLNDTATGLQHKAISLLQEMTELIEQHCSLKNKWAPHYGMFHFHLTRLHANVKECLSNDSSLTSAENSVFFATEQLQNMKTQVDSVKHLILIEDEVEKAMRCPTALDQITEAQSKALERKLQSDPAAWQRIERSNRLRGMAWKKWSTEC